MISHITRARTHTHTHRDDCIHWYADVRSSLMMFTLAHTFGNLLGIHRVTMTSATKAQPPASGGSSFGKGWKMSSTWRCLIVLQVQPMLNTAAVTKQLSCAVLAPRLVVVTAVVLTMTVVGLVATAVGLMAMAVGLMAARPVACSLRMPRTHWTA